jgi:hypothetical protein
MLVLSGAVSVRRSWCQPRLSYPKWMSAKTRFAFRQACHRIRFIPSTKPTRVSKLSTEISLSIIESAGQRAYERTSANSTSELAKEVSELFYESLFTQPYNALCNSVNYVSSSWAAEPLLTKLGSARVSPAEFGSTRWLTQSLVSGVASGIVLGTVGRASHLALRSLGLPVTQSLSLILGGSLFEYAKDIRPGETHFGNMAAGAAMLSTFEAGNLLFGSAKGIYKPLVLGSTGALGSLSHRLVGSMFYEGPSSDLQPLAQDVISGATMNMLLPSMMRFMSRATNPEIKTVNPEVKPNIYAGTSENSSAKAFVRNQGTSGLTSCESLIYCRPSENLAIEKHAPLIRDSKGTGELRQKNSEQSAEAKHKLEKLLQDQDSEFDPVKSLTKPEDAKRAFLDYLKVEARRLGLPEDVLHESNVALHSWPGRSGHYSNYDNRIWIGRDFLNTGSHEIRHMNSALRRTAVYKADPKAFVDMLRTEWLSSMAKGGFRITEPIPQVYSSEPRLAFKSDTTRNAMRALLLEYTNSTPSHQATNPFEIERWFTKNPPPIELVHACGNVRNLIAEVRSEIIHYYAMLDAAIVPCNVLNPASREFVQETANRLRHAHGNSLKDSREIRHLLKSYSNDILGTADPAFYAFSREEIRCNRFMLTRQKSPLTSELAILNLKEKILNLLDGASEHSLSNAKFATAQKRSVELLRLLDRSSKPHQEDVAFLLRMKLLAWEHLANTRFCNYIPRRDFHVFDRLPQFSVKEPAYSATTSCIKTGNLPKDKFEPATIDGDGNTLFKLKEPIALNKHTDVETIVTGVTQSKGTTDLSLVDYYYPNGKAYPRALWIPFGGDFLSLLPSDVGGKVKVAEALPIISLHLENLSRAHEDCAARHSRMKTPWIFTAEQ